jgi:D-alanine-D-alanine ligase
VRIKRMRRTRVSRKLVAVLYNDPPDLQPAFDSDLQEVPLNFEPYYDLEESSMEEEIGEIVQALKSKKFRVYSYNIQDRIQQLLRILKEKKPSVVFNLVESHQGAPFLEMMVAGVYEMLGIPYTGSPPLTLGLCQRKGVTKQILLSNGIPTPRFTLVGDKKRSFQHRLRYPLIAKPAREDGSHGVENESVVFDSKQLRRRLHYIFEEFHQSVIVEEFIDGRELNVSILGSEEPRVLPISEVDFSRMPKHFTNILTYQAKWETRHETYHRTIPVCPARLPRKLEKQVNEIALKAYRIMGCRDYARIDFRVDRRNNPYVLEVNPNPHLSEGMGLMRSAETAGLSFSQTLKAIVQFALKRSQKK